MSKTIFLFIPNYVYVTDLVRTGFLEELSKEYKTVVFLPTLEYVHTYPDFENVEYKLWTIKSKKLWGYMKLLRLGLIRKFDDLLSIQIHYQVAFSDWRRKLLRFIALCIPYKFGTDLFSSIETLSIKKDPDFESLISSYKPALVALCSPGFTDFESEIIILSRKYKLPTLALNFSWDNLTTNAKHLRRTDYLAVWNQFMKDEAIKYHDYDSHHVFISGAMRFDYYFRKKVQKSKEDFLKEKKLDPSLPLVVLTTTSHGVYPFHKDLISILLDARKRKEIPHSNILIRVHPKDDFEQYKDFLNAENIFIDRAGKERNQAGDSRHKIEMENDDMDNLHATLAYADVAINYTSTITLEALACSTPVINICFPKNNEQRHYEYIHYKPIIDSGAVILSHSKDDLIKNIKAILLSPQKVEHELVDKFFYMKDGNSYKRVKEIVGEVIKTL